MLKATLLAALPTAFHNDFSFFRHRWPELAI
jgi:hypothetical protein